MAGEKQYGIDPALRGNMGVGRISNGGFTLIEMLVAIGLMVMASVYFANFFLNRLTHEEVRVVARELMTLNRAILGYYSDKTSWPTVDSEDPDNPGCENTDVAQALSDYIGGVDFGLISFDCSDSYRFIVEREMGNEEMADILAAYLPTADVVEKGNVRMHIYRPRHLTKINIGVYEVNNSGKVFVPFPEDCGNSQISATPQIVCSPNGYSGIGGYKTMIEEDPKRDDGWKVWLRARNDQEGAKYDDVPGCSDPELGGYVPVSFRIMTFCDD